MGLVAEQGAGDNAAPLSVSELSATLKRVVEDRFGFVRVRGELSGVKRAASGHFYCSLKDESAVIDAVMWKGTAQRLAFRPEDGIEVVASGKLTTYPGRSKYQIVVETMEIAGEGALLALLEKTRARLAAEGLFATERKRALPYLPRVIGVVTSPTGAVIRDILHRLADRFPSHVLVWPVLVQGDGAAAQVAAAVEGFSALPAAWPGAAPRSGDRRARRWFDRGPLGLQRGGGGARHRREHDPGDQRGRPRNRHQPCRFRRRHARANSNGGGGNGGAGARGPAQPDSRTCAAPAPLRVAACRHGARAARSARPAPAPARGAAGSGCPAARRSGRAAAARAQGPGGRSSARGSARWRATFRCPCCAVRPPMRRSGSSAADCRPHSPCGGSHARKAASLRSIGCCPSSTPTSH